MPPCSPANIQFCHAITGLVDMLQLPSSPAEHTTPGVAFSFSATSRRAILVVVPTLKAWAGGFWQEDQEVRQIGSAVAEAKESCDALHGQAGQAVRCVLGLPPAASPT